MQYPKQYRLELDVVYCIKNPIKANHWSTIVCEHIIASEKQMFTIQGQYFKNIGLAYA